MNGCIVLPTYNERENLRRLLPRLLPYCIKYHLDILVVDDNSPDGSAKIVSEHIYDQKKRKQRSCIYLLTGKKQGLGQAYIRGFSWCLKHHYDILFEMDADLSHDPAFIPRFLKALKHCDVVIGSRYVLGGSIVGWGVWRTLISAWGNLFARSIAGIPIHDCTSGFRAMKTTLLKKISLKKLPVKGYAFQLHVLYELSLLRAVIQEIPITFVDRHYGISKLGLSDVLEFIGDAVRIRLGKLF